MKTERGLFEDTDALAGTQVINVYDAAGRRIGRWEAVSGVTDATLIEALYEFLDRKAPKPALQLVRSTATRKARRAQ